MPTYVFTCSCGETQEVWARIKDRNKKVVCKKCGKAMTRETAAPPFHLKGSGWYVTDYKDKK